MYHDVPIKMVILTMAQLNYQRVRCRLSALRTQDLFGHIVVAWKGQDSSESSGAMEGAGGTCNDDSMGWLKRENLQETIDFPMKIMGFSCNFSLRPINWMVSHLPVSHVIATKWYAWY